MTKRLIPAALLALLAVSGCASHSGMRHDSSDRNDAGAAYGGTRMERENAPGASDPWANDPYFIAPP